MGQRDADRHRPGRRRTRRDPGASLECRLQHRDDASPPGPGRRLPDLATDHRQPAPGRRLPHY
ncbi:hypothetical protein ACPA9J_02145 [Pseudomonas aeruginosa]